MEEEKTVKNPGVNLLTLILMKLQTQSGDADSPADYHLTRLHQLIARLAGTTSQIRKEMKKKTLDKQKHRGKLKSILQKTLRVIGRKAFISFIGNLRG